MKRLAILSALALCIASFAPAASAQSSDDKNHVNFGVSGPVTAGVINNQINNIIDGNTNGVFYPGGGVEFNAGWFGFRVEAGDEIMFLNNGHSNNFRATLGPQIRF